LSKPKNYKSIMLSSTFIDLKEHRQKAIDAIAKYGYMPRVMEFSGASASADVIDTSLQMVGDAVAYVGVISLKYGQTPEDTKRNAILPAPGLTLSGRWLSLIRRWELRTPRPKRWRKIPRSCLRTLSCRKKQSAAGKIWNQRIDPMGLVDGCHHTRRCMQLHATIEREPPAAAAYRVRRHRRRPSINRSRGVRSSSSAPMYTAGVAERLRVLR
jgi:hypothetical protein